MKEGGREKSKETKKKSKHTHTESSSSNTETAARADGLLTFDFLQPLRQDLLQLQGKRKDSQWMQLCSQHGPSRMQS